MEVSEKEMMEVIKYISNLETRIVELQTALESEREKIRSYETIMQKDTELRWRHKYD